MSHPPAPNPKARTLPQFLAMLEDGEFADDGTKALKQINEALKDAANTVGKGAATLTLKIGFKIDKGIVEISSKIDTKLPDPPRARTIAWTTPEGHFTPQNPNQYGLPGIHTVITGDGEDEAISV